MSEYHVPVLLTESTGLLDIAGNPSGVYADLTFGGGGHSREILRQLGRNGRLFGFDQDIDALANVPGDSRFTFINGNFRFMRSALRLRGVGRLDGVLADLGVSSHHFDDAGRGFSFRYDAELDMRMNRKARLTARDVLNGYDMERLREIFREYGELDGAGRVASAVVAYRNFRPVATVDDFKRAVERFIPRNDANKFLSKLFQAVRIEVNGEMEALKMALEQSLKVLKPGGRLVVITYHSLEDRLGKNFMRNGTFDSVPEKDFYGNVASPFGIITRKAVTPSQEELENNGRSRSAKLRAAIKK